MMERSVVLFPAPLRPTRLTTSPFSMESETSNRMWLRP